MNALDVISIVQAKNWLNAPDDDNIERLIGSAIDWVETYTGYRLFQRTEVIQIPSCHYALTPFPIQIDSVKDTEGKELKYTTEAGVFSTYINTQKGALVTVTVGYSDPLLIKPVLVEAAYKMLTYLYENRDIYVASLPTDIQFMINKLRRNLI